MLEAMMPKEEPDSKRNLLSPLDHKIDNIVKVSK
jgi:hypothetical protein